MLSNSYLLGNAWLLKIELVRVGSTFQNMEMTWKIK